MRCWSIPVRCRAQAASWLYGLLRFDNFLGRYPCAAGHKQRGLSVFAQFLGRRCRYPCAAGHKQRVHVMRQRWSRARRPSIPVRCRAQAARGGTGKCDTHGWTRVDTRALPGTSSEILGKSIPNSPANGRSIPVRCRAQASEICKYGTPKSSSTGRYPCAAGHKQRAVGQCGGSFSASATTRALPGTSSEGRHPTQGHQLRPGDHPCAAGHTQRGARRTSTAGDHDGRPPVRCRADAASGRSMAAAPRPGTPAIGEVRLVAACHIGELRLW